MKQDTFWNRARHANTLTIVLAVFLLPVCTAWILLWQLAVIIDAATYWWFGKPVQHPGYTDQVGTASWTDKNG